MIFILLAFCFSLCLQFSDLHSLPGKHIWDSTQMSPHLEEASSNSCTQGVTLSCGHGVASTMTLHLKERTVVLKHGTPRISQGLAQNTDSWAPTLEFLTPCI